MPSAAVVIGALRVKRSWYFAIFFLSYFTRETTIMTTNLLSCTPIVFWKGVYTKRKEFTLKVTDGANIDITLFFVV